MAAKRVVETVDPYSLSPGNTPATSPLSDASPVSPRFIQFVSEDENIDEENLISCSRVPPLPSTSIPLASFRDEDEDIEIVQVVKTQLPLPVQTSEEDEQGISPPTYKNFIKRKSQLVLSTESIQEKLKEEAIKDDQRTEQLIEPSPQKVSDAVHDEATQVPDHSIQSMTVLKEASQYQVHSIKQRTQQKLSSSDQLIQMIKERERLRKEEIARREQTRQRWRSRNDDASKSSPEMQSTSKEEDNIPSEPQTTIEQVPSKMDATEEVQVEESVAISSPREQLPTEETSKSHEQSVMEEEAPATNNKEETELSNDIPVSIESPPSIPDTIQPEAPTEKVEPTELKSSSETQQMSSPDQPKKTVKRVIKKKPSVIIPSEDHPRSPLPSPLVTPNTPSPRIKRVIKAVSTKNLASPPSSPSPSIPPSTDTFEAAKAGAEKAKGASDATTTPNKQVVRKKVVKVKPVAAKTTPQKMEP